MAGRRIHQVPQVIATYKSVAPQLKGIKRWRGDLFCCETREFSCLCWFIWSI